LHVEEGGAVEVTRELVLPDPPDEVWTALTDPDALEEWFANDVELELEPGGEGVFRWDSGEVRRATVEEVEPGRRLAFWWSEEEGEETLVAIEHEEVPDGTRVTVTESAPEASAWACALELRALAGLAVV
jgi:uncharacterized protein YndB with AHSA1/START domain